MRPWPPIAALLLACLAPAPALAGGVDLPTVQEDVKGPCVDLARATEGDVTQAVALQPCGPNAEVRVWMCDDKIIIGIEVKGLDRPGDTHLSIRTGPVRDLVDIGASPETESTASECEELLG